MASNRSDCDSVESVEKCWIRAAAVDRVATSSAVASPDEVNASAVMVLVDSFHAADKPFSVNPNPIYRNRADVVLLLVEQNSSIEMMEYHFRCHRFRHFD